MKAGCESGAKARGGGGGEGEALFVFLPFLPSSSPLSRMRGKKKRESLYDRSKCTSASISHFLPSRKLSLLFLSTLLPPRTFFVCLIPPSFLAFMRFKAEMERAGEEKGEARFIGAQCLLFFPVSFAGRMRLLSFLPPFCHHKRISFLFLLLSPLPSSSTSSFSRSQICLIYRYVRGGRRERKEAKVVWWRLRLHKEISGQSSSSGSVALPFPLSLGR